jgi:hypothetical protein
MPRTLITREQVRNFKSHSKREVGKIKASCCFAGHVFLLKSLFFRECRLYLEPMGHSCPSGSFFRGGCRQGGGGGIVYDNM